MISIRCPRCRSIGNIDDEQEQGKCSIICSVCEFHWYNSHDKRMEDRK